MQKKGLSAAFVFLFLENFLSLLSRSTLNLLPTYLSSLGASKTYIGLFMNTGPLILVLFVFLFNGIADRLDKKKLLYGGFLIQTLSLTAMFFYSNSLTLMMLFQVISSVSFAISFTTIPNLMLENLSRNSRASGIALFGISGVLSNPVGSFIGEILLKNAHPRYLIISGVVITILAIFLVPFIPHPKKAEKHTEVSFWKLVNRIEIKKLILPALVLGGAWSVLCTFIPNFSLERLGSANLSLYFTALTAVAILSRVFFSRMLDQFSKKRLLALAYLSAALAMTNMVFLHLPWQLCLTGLIYGFGHSILYPVLTALFVNSGSDRENYTLNNIFTTCYTMGNVFISTLMGFAGDLFGSVYIFAGMGFLALVLVFYSLMVNHEKVLEAG